MKGNFTRAEYKIILTVINFTWGYQKDTAPITFNLFMASTNLSRPAVNVAIKQLKEKQVVDVIEGWNQKKPNQYRLNNPEGWGGSSKVYLTANTIKTRQEKRQRDNSVTKSVTSSDACGYGAAVTSAVTAVTKGGKQ